MGDSRKRSLEAGVRGGKRLKGMTGSSGGKFLENSAGQGRDEGKMIASSWRQSVLRGLLFLLGIAGFAGDGRWVSLWRHWAKDAPIGRPKKNNRYMLKSVTADTYCCYLQG